jgi:hypothetical protein
MKRIEDYAQGERIAFYWTGEGRAVNATVHEPHITCGKCRAYLIANVTTPCLEGNKVLVEESYLREPFDEPTKQSTITVTVDDTPDGAGVLFGAYVGMMNRLCPDDDTKRRALRNAAEIVRWQDDPDFQKAIQSAVYKARKADVSNPQPDLLPALENLLTEFDAYDRAMAEIGRGHEDYGGQREAARVAILRAKKGQ